MMCYPFGVKRTPKASHIIARGITPGFMERYKYLMAP